MSDHTIAISRLTKTYGAQVAVADLTLAVPQGSICGLLGPNGAGKTTTIKCMLGLASPTTGEIRFDGLPLTPQTFASLSYVPERSALYDKVRVEDHLRMMRHSYASYDDALARRLLTSFDIDLRKRAGKLSKGQRTAVALTLAFATRPSTMILDEPASGLDPLHQRATLDLMIDASANGTTILFSSHQITQVERAADRVAILERGRLILEGEVDALKDSEKIVEAVFPSAPGPLGGLDGDVRVRRCERRERVVRAFVHSDAGGVARELGAFGATSVHVYDQNLEDIFMSAVEETRLSLNGEASNVVR